MNKLYISSGSQDKLQFKHKGFSRGFYSLWYSQLLIHNYWEVPSLCAYLCSRLHACQSDSALSAAHSLRKNPPHSCTCGQKYSLCNHHKSNCTNDILSQSRLPGVTFAVLYHLLLHLSKLMPTSPPIPKKQQPHNENIPAITQHRLSLATSWYCASCPQQNSPHTSLLPVTPWTRTHHHSC